MFNGTDRELSGSIEVLDPNGDFVLEEGFDLPSSEGDDEEKDDNDSEGDDRESMEIYGDVLTDSGEYTVSIELDREVGGENGATETVEVANPDEEHVTVFFGADQAGDSIVVAVIEEFSDLEEYDDKFSK